MKENTISQKKKILLVIIVALIFLLISFFIIKIYYKNIISGNTITSKNTDSIVNNILNMKSYEADVTIEITSNKNKNTYKLKQQNIGDKAYKQIIEEPRNLEGMEIIFKDNNLEIKNTKLNINKIYENYKYIAENELILTSFVKDYNPQNEIKMEEDENQIILEVKIKKELNRYEKYKKLYINKGTGLPIKMEIKDDTQKTLVYILYNEIKINGLQEIV